MHLDENDLSDNFNRYGCAIVETSRAGEDAVTSIVENGPGIAAEVRHECAGCRCGERLVLRRVLVRRAYVCLKPDAVWDW